MEVARVSQPGSEVSYHTRAGDSVPHVETNARFQRFFFLLGAV